MNQHENTKTVAAKKATTARLQSEVKPAPENLELPVIRTTDLMRNMISEAMMASQNKLAVIQAKILALEAEERDEQSALEACQAAMSVLEGVNQPPALKLEIAS